MTFMRNIKTSSLGVPYKNGRIYGCLIYLTDKVIIPTAIWSFLFFNLKNKTRELNLIYILILLRIVFGQNIIWNCDNSLMLDVLFSNKLRALKHAQCSLHPTVYRSKPCYSTCVYIWKNYSVFQEIIYNENRGDFHQNLRSKVRNNK